MRAALTAIACFAMISFTPACARAADFPVFEVSQLGDLEKNCHEISHEITAMEDLILDAEQTRQSSAITGAGVSVAKTVGSYFVGTLAGGLGILAAGYLVSEATDDRAENAMALQDNAEKRRSFMEGIYNARGCMGPLEALARIEPASGDADAEPKPRVRRYND